MQDGEKTTVTLWHALAFPRNNLPLDNDDSIMSNTVKRRSVKKRIVNVFNCSCSF